MEPISNLTLRGKLITRFMEQEGLSRKQAEKAADKFIAMLEKADEN